MQRVDQDEAGAEAGRAPGREIGQIAQVAVPPRVPGAQRVQLDGESPGTAGRRRSGAASCAGITRPDHADLTSLARDTSRTGRTGRTNRVACTGRIGGIAEGGEDCRDGFIAHRDFLAAPVPVVMRNSGRLGPPDQLRVRHWSMIARAELGISGGRP